MALSADGCTVCRYVVMIAVQLTGWLYLLDITCVYVCSGAPDETLQFWKVFEKPASRQGALKQKSSNSVLQSVGIR